MISFANFLIISFPKEKKKRKFTFENIFVRSFKINIFVFVLSLFFWGGLFPHRFDFIVGLSVLRESDPQNVWAKLTELAATIYY